MTKESLNTKERLGLLTRYSFEAAAGSALVFISGVNKILRPEVLVDTTLVSSLVGGLIVGSICATASTWMLDPEHMDDGPTQPPPGDFITEQPDAEVITLHPTEHTRPDQLAA